MADANFDGVISSDEALSLISMINSSLTSSSFFDEETMLTKIPFSMLEVDGVDVEPYSTNVEITNLVGSASSSEDPLVIYINETLVASGLIDDGQSTHSVAINGYYGNPAFEMNYTINLPNGMTLNDIRNYMMTIDSSSTSANIVPAPVSYTHLRAHET